MMNEHFIWDVYCDKIKNKKKEKNLYDRKIWKNGIYLTFFYAE